MPQEREREREREEGGERWTKRRTKDCYHLTPTLLYLRRDSLFRVPLSTSLMRLISQKPPAPASGHSLTALRI